MKFENLDAALKNLEVAPLVGAWIEIQPESEDAWWDNVAPLVGAWIEISKAKALTLGAHVAPLVGAWIEIRLPFPPTLDVMSLLL